MAVASKSKKSKEESSKKRSFVKFKEKVIKSLEKAGFTKEEIERLERILDTADKRNLIFIQALLTSLQMAGIPPEDLARLKVLLKLAYNNIINGVKPVLDREMSLELIKILSRNDLPYKAAHRLDRDLQLGDDTLVTQFNESLDEELVEFSIGSQTGEGKKKSKLSKTIPRKKETD